MLGVSSVLHIPQENHWAPLLGHLGFVCLLLCGAPHLRPVFLLPSFHAQLLGLRSVLIFPHATSLGALWTQGPLVTFYGQSPHSPSPSHPSIWPQVELMAHSSTQKIRTDEILLQHEDLQIFVASLNLIKLTCMSSPNHQNRPERCSITRNLFLGPWCQNVAPTSRQESFCLSYLPAYICPQGSHVPLSGVLLRSQQPGCTTVLWGIILMPLQVTRMPKILPGGHRMVCWKSICNT